MCPQNCNSELLNLYSSVSGMLILLVQFCSRFIYHKCCDNVAHFTERIYLTTITLLYYNSALLFVLTLNLIVIMLRPGRTCISLLTFHN